MFKYIALNDTVYFGFSANLLSGAGADGATPLWDVRECGAAASAAPVLSGSATLLTHANYLDGSHEVSIAATSGNGFAANTDYLVYVCLTIDSVTPGMCVGGFRTAPVPSNVTQYGGTAGTFSGGRPEVNTTLIEGVDATNQIRDSILTDATRFAGADVGTIKTAVDTEVAAILAAVDTEIAAILAIVGTTGVVVDAASKSGYRLSATGVDDILDDPIPEAGKFAWPGSIRTILAFIGVLTRNKVVSDGTNTKFRNDADSADLVTFGKADDTVTFTQNEAV